MGRSGRSGSVVVLGAAALALAGCAWMPTSGPIREGAGSGADDRLAGSDVRVFAPGPKEGMTQFEIAEGFINAMNSVEPDFKTAKEYLAPERAGSWDPYKQVTVYDVGDRQSVSPDGTGFSPSVIGSVSEDGAYQPAPPGSRAAARFEFVQTPAGLRISEVANGVLVSNLDFTREYLTADGPINLYFFDPNFTVLVPDPIYLPKRADLLTEVTKRLLKGPTRRLRPAVRTAIPPEAKLAAEPVTVENGVVTVNLGNLTGLDAEDKKRLTAQLVWTLSALSPPGSTVQVIADGVATMNPTSTANWPALRPADQASGRPGYLLKEGLLYSIGAAPGAAPTQELGPEGLGEGVEALADFAVAPSASPASGRLAAGVSSDGTKLIVTKLGEQPAATVVVENGTQLGSPSWDRFDRLWVLDRLKTGSKVYYLVNDGAKWVSHQVRVDGLAGQQISQLAVSDDGTRVALITKGEDPDRSTLLLGLVEVRQTPSEPPDNPDAPGPVSITTLVPLAPQLDRALDVAWADSQQLVVLVESGDLTQPYLVGVDGREATPQGPVNGDAVSVTAAPGAPILVGTAQGDIWQQSTLSVWQKLAEGSATPHYPG